MIFHIVWKQMDNKEISYCISCMIRIMYDSDKKKYLIETESSRDLKSSNLKL